MKDAYKNTAALFESALEAVIGTDGEQVVFMNPAAVSALGEHRGEALSSLLPAEARAWLAEAEPLSAGTTSTG